jgi:hypothetical protein
MIELVQIENSKINEYKEIWEKSPNSIVFNDFEWLKLVCQSNEKVFLYGIYDNGILIGGFPLIKLNSRFMNYYSNTSLTPYTGIFLLEKYNSAPKKREVLESFIEFIEKLSLDNFHFFFSPYEKDFLPFKRSNYNIILNLTYKIDLLKDVNKIYQSLRNDKKRNIKAAEKELISVSFEKNSNLIIDLVKKTYRRQNKSINWISSAEQLLNNYQNYFQVTSFIGDKPAASLCIVYDKSRAYYLFGGFNDALNNYNAGPYAMWNAILKAKALNKKVFDFEGSEIYTIEKYFQSFGGEQELYFSINVKSKKQRFLNFIK